jgi:hypothetical protein
MEYSGGDGSSQRLIDALAPTDDDKLYWLPIVWSMVLTRHLRTDLDKLFSSNVPLWLPEVCV